MKELQNFNYANRQLRTIEENGVTWFALKDVCEILELSNTSMVASRLDDEEVTKLNLEGLQGETNFINESGFYTVVLRSDKPQAKPFRKWVTSQVLPSIKKTGSYAASKQKSIIDLLESAAAELKSKDEQNKDLRDVLLTYQKYGKSLLVREFVKIAYTDGKIEIKEQQMWKILRSQYFDNLGFPYARYREYFEVIYRVVGNGKAKATVKLSPKGINYFIHKFLKEAQ